jgi:ribosomal protein L19
LKKNSNGVGVEIESKIHQTKLKKIGNKIENKIQTKLVLKL